MELSGCLHSVFERDILWVRHHGSVRLAAVNSERRDSTIDFPSKAGIEMLHVAKSTRKRIAYDPIFALGILSWYVIPFSKGKSPFIGASIIERQSRLAGYISPISKGTSMRSCAFLSVADMSVAMNLQQETQCFRVLLEHMSGSEKNAMHVRRRRLIMCGSCLQAAQEP